MNTSETPLAHVVTVHETTKAILSDSHHVNLRALDATVRSLRGGTQLRAFAEVSAQMRQWSQELHTKVVQFTKLTAEQVNVFSAFEKHQRTVHFLTLASRDPHAARLLAQGLAQANAQGHEIEQTLLKLQRRVRGLLEELEQLGLMACVLSTSALIEAATSGDSARELTIVSQDFSERSQQVTESIRRMLASDRQGRR